MPDIVSPPERLKPLSTLRVGSHPSFVWALINTFAVDRAVALYSTELTRFPMPSGAYMSKTCRLQLCYAVVSLLPSPSTTALAVTDNIAFNALCECAAALST